MFISFIIFPTILDDSVTSGSNIKTIDINQNDVNHEMKNEIDTYYEDDDHYAPNNLDEEADDMVSIRGVAEDTVTIAYFHHLLYLILLK